MWRWKIKFILTIPNKRAELLDYIDYAFNTALGWAEEKVKAMRTHAMDKKLSVIQFLWYTNLNIVARFNIVPGFRIYLSTGIPLEPSL